MTWSVMEQWENNKFLVWWDDTHAEDGPWVNDDLKLGLGKFQTRQKYWRLDSSIILFRDYQ